VSLWVLVGAAALVGLVYVGLAVVPATSDVVSSEWGGGKGVLSLGYVGSATGRTKGVMGEMGTKVVSAAAAAARLRSCMAR
jgi:hypothetical protein